MLTESIWDQFSMFIQKQHKLEQRSFSIILYHKNQNFEIPQTQAFSSHNTCLRILWTDTNRISKNVSKVGIF